MLLYFFPGVGWWWTLSEKADSFSFSICFSCATTFSNKCLWKAFFGSGISPPRAETENLVEFRFSRFLSETYLFSLSTRKTHTLKLTEEFPAMSLTTKDVSARYELNGRKREEEWRGLKFYWDFDWDYAMSRAAETFPHPRSRHSLVACAINEIYHLFTWWGGKTGPWFFFDHCCSVSFHNRVGSKNRNWDFSKHFVTAIEHLEPKFHFKPSISAIGG